ncbi:hypothetical protein CAOG_06359 [Capsaspora owczarzaki ATCC 30864]|uniref:Uncharacterized protein n=1 Tax=Capsaspora owczarzaki (strain ATCC 30864) TaxID=595528 RepID=A0A0D2ULJ7_CAPO3|nr:hypothetical protein CAOG_06359 [Capsaspora owczarzaki ATCC 30864]KJE95981.1 hypothetical protein CAOG_006359 [Capsaspora owczarzaki ATCC 30864]|eukprot:XP_004345108.2 hypothetical protein CAOG_06359 [Capsaspora owczarzaki ATCC 30864]
MDTPSIIRVEVPQANSTKMMRVELATETVGSLRGQLLKKLMPQMFPASTTTAIVATFPSTNDATPVWSLNDLKLFLPRSPNNTAIGDFLTKDSQLLSSLGIDTNTVLILKSEGVYSGPSGAFEKALGPIFGVPLAAATERSGGTLEYPALVEKVIQTLTVRGLDKEGIFRLSGTASQIQALKVRFDQGENVNLDEVHDPHVVSGLLKLFLREMPEPLLTFALFDSFVAAQNAVNETQRASYFRACVAALPPCNYALLKRLLGFLLEVSRGAAVNKMALENLATVFGPNILKREGETPLDMVKNTATVNSVCNQLIKLSPQIFENPEPSPFVAIASALYSYTPNTPAELQLTESDIIFVAKAEASDGWWEGEVAGRAGLFPENYVKVMCKLNINANKQAKAQAANPGDSQATKRLQDELAALQLQLKQESQQRKDAEAILALLSDNFAELGRKLRALENANEVLRAEVTRLQQSTRS